jgi:3',5'-cyclic AMP phosphodiesterase CpdA
MIACLHHAQSLSAADGGRPDVVFTGGDNINDAFAADFDRTKAQFDLWNRVLKDHCSLPLEHCIGNHDVWGWKRSSSKTTGQEQGWGKDWAMEAFGLTSRFRAFDRAGWRIVVLDSTFPKGDPKDPHGYEARLDDEQFEWLAGELAASTGKHTLVLSHIPILSASVFFDGDNEKSGDWKVPGAWMHLDARRIKDLFRKHPHVRLCLSGHVHLVDRVDYLGVAYLCNGAVSGGWWDGPYHECNNGYALVDLFDDGAFDHRYVEYGWQAATK